MKRKKRRWRLPCFIKEMIGKIDFIKHVEGIRGVERLKIRLNKYYPDIDLNSL